MPPTKILAAFFIVLLSCFQVPAAPLTSVTLAIRSFTLSDPSERNCIFFTFSAPSTATNSILITPPPLEIPKYNCDGCRFVRVTSNSSAAAILDSQFSFVNASLSAPAATYASGLLLQLKSSTFPTYPALVSCTLCLAPFTPSLPSGSHSITISSHTASLLPNASACPSPPASCPLSFLPFDAASPVDIATAIPLSIPPLASFNPKAIPASSTRTVFATFPQFPLPPTASFTAVSSGADFGCGLASSASQCAVGSSNVYCWGSYNLNSKWYPTQIPLPPAASGISVCAGFDHACAVTNSGDVYCWGRNLESQCGHSNSSYVPSSEPARVPGVSGAQAVKCGKFSTCASVGIGLQHRLMCWGNKLGPSALGYPSINPQITWPSPAIFPLAGGKPLKEGIDTFSIGSFTGCALVAETPSTSSLWCWGDIGFLRPNGFAGTIPFSASTMSIPGTAGTDIAAVAVGATHACTVDFGVGGLYCWGSNTFCQLGIDPSCKFSNNPPQATPARAQQQLKQKFTTVTVSDRHSCAITDDKSLYCWGQNLFGYLGNSSAPLTVVPTPVLVTLNSSALSVSASSFTAGPATCAVADTSPKKLYCWGYSFYGAVGIGLRAASQSVRDPELVAKVVSVGSVVVRTIANSSMWTQGLGALESEIRTIKGKDVLVVVLNESSAEFDWEASAFDLERGKTAVVDVTFPINCASYTGSLAITAFVPCSQRPSCTSCEPGVSSNRCKWCTTDFYNPDSGYCTESACRGNFFTLTSVQSCALSARPVPSPLPTPSPEQLDCTGRACGWPSSADNAAAAGVAAFILSFIVSLLQPYAALSFQARRVILQKREAAAAAQARAAELEQQVDAPAAQVPTYSQLLCPFTLSCPRSSLYSSIDSVSIEMLARRAQHPSAMSIGNLPPAVHASGHVDADFDGPWGQASPLQRFKIVWRRLVPSYIVVLGVYFATSFIFFKYVIYDSEGRVKPVKGSCFSLAEMQENLCVFAAGQGAYGLIAFGQAAVGLIVIAQGSVGIILAVGQGALSLGFSAGQVATGCFVEACQIGIGLIGIRRCMLGLRAFAWMDAPLHLVDSTFIATCVCNNAGRQQRGAQETSDAAAAEAAVAAGMAVIADARAAEAAAAAAAAAPAANAPSAQPAYMRAPRRIVPRGGASPAATEQV